MGPYRKLQQGWLVLLTLLVVTACAGSTPPTAVPSAPMSTATPAPTQASEAVAPADTTAAATATPAPTRTPALSTDPTAVSETPVATAQLVPPAPPVEVASTTVSEPTATAGTEAAPAIGNTQVGEIRIGELPLDWEWLSGGLKRYTSVFGVNVFATSDTPDDKLVHSVNVLAEYLDNDADGLVDNELVLQALLSVNASLIMSDTEDDFDRSLDELPERFHESVEDGDILFVALFADEVPPNEGPDASLEEILHLITQAGYARAYPDAFGEEKGSEIANYMDVARGGHFAEGDPSDCEDDPDENWATGQCAIPPNGVYPDDAWYTYTDTTCSYDCMITEYTYWAITSVLGAQANRCDDIADEWVLCTASQVESRDNGVYRLLGDTSFALPTRIPKGDYDYTKIEVEH